MKSILITFGAMAIAGAFATAQDQPPAGEHPGGRPQRQRWSAEDTFKRLDTNSDGNVTLEEFKAGPMAQRAPERAEELFKKIDTSGDGNITLEEFKAFRPQWNPEETFKRLDTDKDGALTLAEFKAGPMAQRNPERAEEIFKKIDADGDGKVTLEEFKAFRPEPRPGERGRGPRGGGKPDGQ